VNWKDEGSCDDGVCCEGKRYGIMLICVCMMSDHIYIVLSFPAYARNSYSLLRSGRNAVLTPAAT
jgi:hypothetical protein